MKEDPWWVFGMMASQKAEEIKAKFTANAGAKLTESETRYWARLRRVYDGDLDAFDRPDREVDALSEADAAEEAVIAAITAQLQAANARSEETEPAEVGGC